MLATYSCSKVWKMLLLNCKAGLSWRPLLSWFEDKSNAKRLLWFRLKTFSTVPLSELRLKFLRVQTNKLNFTYNYPNKFNDIISKILEQVSRYGKVKLELNMMPIQQCVTCAQLDLMVQGQLPHRCQIINQFLKFMWRNRINFLRSTFQKNEITIFLRSLFFQNFNQFVQIIYEY